jgi:hypothetical protein
MMNPRLISLIALVMPALAQTPPSLPVKSPEGLEEDLRRRADEFYQLQIDGKFRAAEKYVCESSQEAYYLTEKRKWLSKEVAKVEFEPDYARAKVSVRLGTEANMPPVGKVSLKSIVPTEWKLEAGAWCFVMPSEQEGPRETPFGKMLNRKSSDEAKPTEIPGMVKVEEGTVRNAVAASKKELRVKGYEASSDQVEFANGISGMVELELAAPEMRGLEVKLSATRLQSKEKAVLTVNYKPESRTAKATSQVVVRVVPTGQTFRFRLYFDVPEEIMKQLPKAASPQQRK